MKNQNEERTHPSDVNKLSLLYRGRWAASELRLTQREMAKLGDSACLDVALWSGAMAQVVEDLVEALGSTAHRLDRMKNSARFLLDLLQRSNEEVDAMYGRTDTLEQAAIELRFLVDEETT